MQMTYAKALVRNFLYLECLPAWLSSQLLQGGNFLVLLGESQEERQLLEQLGIPPHRIYSVERKSDIFFAQTAMPGPEVSLYYGELTEFIAHYLQSNQRFLVFNLDVFGSYRSSIDPVMTEILLFARRHPRTVVATYSNVGRDNPQLVEGLKSLALFYWWLPEITSQAVDELYGRYVAAGKSPEFSFNMVLRHMFWVRSHLEHVMLGRVLLGGIKPETAARLLNEEDRLWQSLMPQLATPLTYDEWLAAIAGVRGPSRKAMALDFNILQVCIATYEAHGGFSHTGWFAQYGRTELVGHLEWLTAALTALVSQPLRFAGRESVALESFDHKVTDVPSDLVVWKHGVPTNHVRKLEIPAPSAQLAQLDTPLPLPTTNSNSHSAPPAAKPPASGMKAKTDDLIPLVKQMARDGMTTDEIMRALPRPMDRKSVIAYRASANRKPKRSTASSG